MTDGTPFPPLDTLVSQKRKTEYQLPRRGRQAAPFSYPKLNTKPNNRRLPFSLGRVKIFSHFSLQALA